MIILASAWTDVGTIPSSCTEIWAMKLHNYKVSISFLANLLLFARRKYRLMAELLPMGDTKPMVDPCPWRTMGRGKPIPMMDPMPIEDHG